MADTHTIKQGDTGPSVIATLKGRTGAVQELTGATVVFNMRKVNGAVKIDHAPAVVQDVAGIVRYDWTEGDTDIAGKFAAEFEVTFADGTVESWPNPDNIAVDIIQQIA